VPVVLADTVTALDARHRDGVLVTGSQGGLIAAHLGADRARQRHRCAGDAVPEAIAHIPSLVR